MANQQELVLTKGTSFAPASAQNICWLIPNHWMWAKDPVNNEHLLVRASDLSRSTKSRNPPPRTYLLDESFVQNVKYTYNELKRFARSSVDWDLAPEVTDRSRVPVEVCIALGVPLCPFSLEPHELSPVSGEGTREQIVKKASIAQKDLKRLYAWIVTAILRRLSGRKGFLFQPSTIPLNAMKAQLKGLIHESWGDFHFGLGYKEIDEIAPDDKKRRHNGNSHAPAIRALTNSCDHEGGSSSANSSSSVDSKGKKKARLSPPPPIVTLGPGTIITKTKDPRTDPQRARTLDFFVPTTSQAPLQVTEGNDDVNKAQTVIWKNETNQLAKCFPNVIAKSPSPIPRLASPPPTTQGAILERSEVVANEKEARLIEAFDVLVNRARVTDTPAFIQTAIDPTTSQVVLAKDPKIVYFNKFNALEHWFHQESPHLHPLNLAAEDALAKLRDRREIFTLNPEFKRDTVGEGSGSSK
ncbi:hypothetical protein SISSUDRAFT_1067506 [Sistotremastrum suecicum HHB10207 ss-3]|uniref:Uncharacterized protein n=1 Tax=Sistotremastrum suecicum HHB10207 ss-3 TaxID=1314776 RepID=A0A165X1M8_9AGAM|nr:hypothetical protein SISSUDRAFT_1067506 [Sistotremastrum suecicum HHB10207 ss-3]